MQQRYLRQVGLFGAFLLLACCGVACSTIHEMRGMLQDLQQVQKEFVKAGYDGVQVSLMKDSSSDGSYLTVSVVNSPLRALPADQKRAKALELARLAYKTYPSPSALRGIRVAFTIQRSYLGIFHYFDARDSVYFDIQQLTAGMAA